MSTSTRNFPNRLGIDTRVYLGSAELAAVCALLGRIPTVAEYMEQMNAVAKKAGDIYRYMNFDQIDEFATPRRTPQPDQDRTAHGSTDGQPQRTRSEMQTDNKPREEGGKRQRVRANMVNVYIKGKRHVVPEHATIMRAIEYAGHQIIRGAGCREGFAAPAAPSTGCPATTRCTPAWPAPRWSRKA